MNTPHPRVRFGPYRMMGLLMGAAFLWIGIACDNIPPEPPPDGGGGGDAALGQVTYADRCKPCHGDPGQNNGEIASDIIGAEEAFITGILTSEAHPAIEDLGEDDYANLAAYLAQDGGVTPPEENPFKAVAFQHPSHMVLFECTTCHHTEPADAKLAACDVCHLEEWVGGVAPLKEAMHAPAGTAVGNAGCRSCHDGRTADGSWECSFCHTGLKDL